MMICVAGNAPGVADSALALARLGPEGSFRTLPVPPGWGVLVARARRPGVLPQAKVVEFTISPDDRSVSHEIRISTDEGGTVSGRIAGLGPGETANVTVVPDAEALAGLSMDDLGNLPVAQTFTSAERGGSFRVEGVPPGQYWVIARVLFQKGRRRELGWRVASQNVEVDPAIEQTPVLLQFKAQRGSSERAQQ